MRARLSLEQLRVILAERERLERENEELKQRCAAAEAKAAGLESRSPAGTQWLRRAGREGDPHAVRAQALLNWEHARSAAIKD